jgi:MFS family permease
MSDKITPSKSYRTFVLVLLTVVYGFNFIDRQIVGILAPFIQKDLGLTNTELGLLIGLAFAMWSGFTALTGLAGNFWQIGLARMGVGIGEAGGSPPSHSIISDLYAKEERAGALGVYSMGIPLGIMAAYFATASLMGSGDADVDWRRIFIFLGLTGVALAVVVKLVLREPKRGAMEFENHADIVQPPFKESLKSLLRIPAWWAMCFGIAFGSFVSYAFSAFQTKYVRLLDPSFDFQTLVIVLGIINGTTYAGGAFLGAKVADKWGVKTIRAYGWLPAIAIAMCLPLGVMSFWVDTVWLHLGFTTFFLFFLGIYLGPSFAIAQTLAPINMRAMSTALFFFILNMIALGGGPTFAGWLIDVFKESNGELESMRYAMTVTCCMFVPSIISFLVVSRILPRDWAAAEKRNLELAKG